MQIAARVIITFIAVCLSVWGQNQEHLASISQNGGHIAGRLIVQMHRDASPDAVAQTLAVHGSAVHKTIPQLRTHVIRVPEALIDRVAASLERTGLFTVVEQDHVAQGAALPNDPSFASEWHLTKIKASSAWDLTKGSSSIKIAVLDSGVDSSHPDLASKIIPGWNFVADNSDTRDSQGHGTAVAGAIAAATNNYIGVAGVAWSNPIMPLVVLDSSNYASYSDVASAITYAADHGARIINVSLGGSSASTTLQSAVDYAWNKGAVVFAAASNNSSSTPYYPAACHNVVAVSATTQSDTFASFSNYGSWITVSAPGDNILTTTKGGGYGSWYGTSLATPIAAGVGALVFSRNPALSSTQLVNILKQNSDDLGSGGFDQYFGWGRVNAYRAVAAAGGTTVTPPPTTPPPTSGAFTAIRVNAGGGAYTDPQGRQWRSDYGYSGGGTYSTGSSISNTTSPVLYQSERWNSGAFQYQFAVPNGTYLVNLKFAEIYFQQRGQRVLNAVVNGQTVLPNFDIVAQAGGPNISIDRQFTVSVTGGQIVIQLIGVIQNPKINAIEIVAATTQSAAPIIRVNAGGGAYTDSQGNYWSSDFGYLSGNSYSTGNSISGTAAPVLYQSERWGSGTLQYQFAVQNGTRYVTLKFAEIYFTLVGQRKFNVLINGQTVLSNFDIVASAGGSRVAFDRQFPVNVTNGQIVIQLVSVVQNPKINAIEIK
jgi:subtilisin family serine protease